MVSTIRNIILVFAGVALLGQTREPPRVHHGQRILMIGDSITKGYAFGNYTDPSPLRTVYGTAGLLMQDNLRQAPEFLRLSGDYQGLHEDGTPIGSVDSLAGQMKYCIGRGEIRSGDWLIYEDAGEIDMFIHPAPKRLDKDIYRQYRKALGEMIRAAELAIGRDHFILMTMFDYQPRCKWCRWDEPLDDGVHTGNDVFRDTAAEMGVNLIDMNRIMDAANDLVVSKEFGRTVGPDGIHPNVYGNFVMALAILRTLGFDVEHWKLNQVERHFRHPQAGGDVATVWGFNKDPSDDERTALLGEIRDVVARTTLH